MNTEIVAETARATLSGSIPFPEVVRRLLATGVKYCHGDYVALWKTFYSATGDVVTTLIPHEGLPPVAADFDAAGLRAAILDSQRTVSITATLPGVRWRQVRAGHQPQDREGSRRHHPAVSAAAGGPGDRVTTPVEAHAACSTGRWFTRAATLGLLVLVAVLLWPRPLAAAPVPVRFAEGATHGFIVLRTVNGVLLASGDLFQVGRGGAVESRMVFRFKDGSVFDETVVFTQQHVFTLQRYRLVQRGPAFPDDTEISLERASGKYHVKTKPHKNGQEEVLEGTLDLPPDVYNGMVVTVAKNLAPRASATVHLVAFTPTPRLIQLELAPTGEHPVLVGDLTKTATHYVIKPQLGIWLGLFAKLLGRVPPDSHAWIVTDEVPAFVRFEGPLFTTGPVWRIELTSPRWPE